MHDTVCSPYRIIAIYQAGRETPNLVGKIAGVNFQRPGGLVLKIRTLRVLLIARVSCVQSFWFLVFSLKWRQLSRRLVLADIRGRQPTMEKHSELFRDKRARHVLQWGDKILL